MTDCVYGLIDPRDGKYFYVGVTNDRAKRYKDHCAGRSGGMSCGKFINKMRSEGFTPSMEILEDNVSERVVRERYWIYKLSKDGFRLVNKRDVVSVERLGDYEVVPRYGRRDNVTASLDRWQTERIDELVRQTGGTRSEVVRGLLAFALEYIK